ncbi:MAG: hypothetical protein WC886_08035 [Saccharofermentanaceae bacterium]|jgi:hypothetical protein
MLVKILLTAGVLLIMSIAIVNLTPDKEEGFAFWFAGISAIIGCLAGLTAIVTIILLIWS